MHVVCAVGEGWLWLITAYYPSEDEWCDDFRTSDKERMKCSLCGASMIEGKIKHIVDMEKQTIIIKDVPALVCKQCGASCLDDEVVEKLEKMVDELLKNRAEIVIANYSEMAA